jgi:hypothetical protein
MPYDIKLYGGFFMKKSKFFLMGISGIVLVFGLMLTGCPTDGGGTTEDNNWFEPNAVLLTHNTFADGVINSYDKTAWYKFSGESGKVYQVQWNSSTYGDGTKTCSYVYVTAFSDSGSVFFSDISNGWASPQIIFPKSETVYLMVTTSSSGTYAIRYFEIGSLPPQEVMTLSAAWEPWRGEEISLTWNSSAAANYYLYRSTSTDGEYEKIAILKNTSYKDTQLVMGTTYYYKVSAYNSIGEGTQSQAVSIVYTAESTITTLTSGTSHDGSISSAGESDWYKFTADSRKTYEVKWNDSYQGDNTKTVDIQVRAFKSDGTYIFSQDSAWKTPQTISNVSGPVYLRVTAYSTGTGTYAIEYTEK